MDGRLTASSALENCTLVPTYCTLVQALEQRVDAEWFAEKTGSTGVENLLSNRVVSLAGDENDWNLPGCEFLLKLDAAHSRQVYVEDETRVIARRAGRQKLFRRLKPLNVKAFRGDYAAQHPGDGLVVVDNRDRVVYLLHATSLTMRDEGEYCTRVHLYCTKVQYGPLGKNKSGRGQAKRAPALLKSGGVAPFLTCS